MNIPYSLSRRSFIYKAAATGAMIAAPQIVSSSVLGREGNTAPSERIRVGFIGIGQHGTASGNHNGVEYDWAR